MEKNDILKLLCSHLDQKDVLIDEPMCDHTSFKIGGPADFFVIPRTKDQLMQVIQLCNKHQIPYFILGNGSNLLVSDLGYRGVILQVYKNFENFKIEEDTVIAEAGILLSKLSKAIYKASLEGFEFASGIPGTIGGAIYMNAGAYGGDMKGIVESVEVIDVDGQLLTLKRDQLELAYRTSILQEKHYVALTVTLKLKKGNQADIKMLLDDLDYKRKSKQPLELPSAGSTFKRPEGFFAGKLIMDSGLQGFSIGGAQVSVKHCGFVVNKGRATCQDVMDLIQHIKLVVQEKFGVELEPEIKMLGESKN